MPSDATEEARREAEGERGIAPENQSRAEATNAILAAIADMRGEFRDFKTDVITRLDEHDQEFASMRRAIHGTSKPPPPQDGSGVREKMPSISEMAKQGSIASGDVAELQGEVLALRADVAKLTKGMGIGKRWLDWILSVQGLKLAARLATMAGAIYAAFRAAGH